MKIETKFNIGDLVTTKGSKIPWKIRGIAIYKDMSIGYFDMYEEDTEMEEDLILYKKGENKNVK